MGGAADAMGGAADAMGGAADALGGGGGAGEGLAADALAGAGLAAGPCLGAGMAGDGLAGDGLAGAGDGLRLIIGIFGAAEAELDTGAGATADERGADADGLLGDSLLFFFRASFLLETSKD